MQELVLSVLEWTIIKSCHPNSAFDRADPQTHISQPVNYIQSLRLQSFLWEGLIPAD